MGGVISNNSIMDAIEARRGAIRVVAWLVNLASLF